MTWVVDARTREVLDMGPLTLPEVGYQSAQITEAGDRLIWADKPVNADHWVLVTGHRNPVQGNIAIVPVEGSAITLEWLKENLDFGPVRELGPVKMFFGDIHRRELT